MSKYRIPPNAGQFRVQTALGGNYIVINDKTGANQVIIPCRDKRHAEAIRDKLNRNEHNGEVYA